GLQRSLPGRRDPTLVETTAALPGLRPRPGARGARLRRTAADRAAVCWCRCGAGGPRRVVRWAVGLAALSRGPFPACRGALRGLPLRPQRQAALPVGGPGRGTQRGAVGDLLGGLFLLPGNLRQLRSHLREPWRRRGFAVLPVRFGGIVRRRAKRRDLPTGHERQRKGTKQMG